MKLLFLRKMADKTRVHCFEALRHISKTFHETYTIYLRLLHIGSHIGSASWNIQHILWLISPFKPRDAGEILVSFKGRWTSIYYFFGFIDFLRSSRYFSSTVISINFYDVGCGRQPKILVDNFWIPRSKTRVPLPGFTQTWQSHFITFFRINTSLFHFYFQGKLIYSFMDIYVQHLASLCWSEFAEM